MGDRANVLLVLADQWRGTDQGWRGNTEVLTPHLDALAANGVRVPNAYANSPVCGPSRGSLLTGRLPHEHGVVANDLPLRADVPTVAEVLVAEGYRTGWIGKWHLDGLPRDGWVAPGRRRGFEFWASTNCSHEYMDGHYWTGDDEPERRAFQGYEPVAQTDLALDFLSADGDRPFFLVVSYGPPHDPYPDVPEEYLERYGGTRLTPRANATATPADVERLLEYYAAITAVDTQLGRIVAGLDELGVLDDTLVVVSSDHGDMLGSHGRRAKQVPYEESVSVPLVLHWPAGLGARVADDGLIGLVDLPTTVLGLVGAPPLTGAYGRDLSGALRDGGRMRDVVLLGNFVSFDEGFRQGVPEWRGLRDRRVTYARQVDGTPWLYFDNAEDPWQLRNLVESPDRAADVRAADERLDVLLREVGDDCLPARVTLEQLDLVELWNARERELHGQAARLLGGSRDDAPEHGTWTAIRTGTT